MCSAKDVHGYMFVHNVATESEAGSSPTVTATLEIRLGTWQLPTQMPRQVTIFHSLPRQKNAEAIPPVVP